MTDPQNCALICVIDRLAASWLGPYGNTWIETPAANQLAAESVLFENALADSPGLAKLYGSYWTGRHAVCHETDDFQNVIGELTNRGINTLLVTDERLVAEHPLSAGFASRIEVPAPARETAARQILETGLANVFSAALAALAELEPPFLLWMHSQGMSAPWDAPYELRESFAAEDDPQPHDFTAVPSYELPEDYDPDDILGTVHAYAGQVTLLDECLAGLVAALAERNRMPLLTLLTSPRGFPLGEHRIVGDASPALYSETLHVPYLLRRPGGDQGLRRVHRFVQPPDLAATMADWFQIPTPLTGSLARSTLQLANGPTGQLDDRAYALQGDELVFRTPAWQWKLPVKASEEEGSIESEDSRAELFVKPDDRFEANNVAERCPDVVQAMHETAQEFDTAVAHCDMQQLHDLSDVLVHGLN